MNTYLLQYLKPITVFFLAITLLAACSDVEDERLMPAGDGLQIHVTAQGFVSEKPETRTSENGYLTAFSSGDVIGITVVKDGYIAQDNVPYAYNGSSWLPAGNADPIYKYNNGATYFAYYPYNSANNGKSPTEIVSSFEPELNQSNYDDYTKSDLMTWSGSLSVSSVEIKMEHRFALVEVNIPSNAKNITLKIGNQDVVPYNFNGVYRYIAKPANSVTISGTHTVDTEVIEWEKTGIRLEESKYIRLNISNPELSFIDGYRGNIKVNYTDGTYEDINIGDNGIIHFNNGKGKTVKEFVLLDKGNKAYAIGRAVSSAPIRLSFDNSGKLLFRKEVDGYIPIGSYAEFRLIYNDATTVRKRFKQEADLDLMSMAWESIYNYNNYFKGIYDGAGYKISNLLIERTADDSGLFMKTDSKNDTIRNVHVESGTVKGKNYTGAIVGHNYGVVISCSNRASIKGESNVGGIVGSNVASSNNETGEIISCYNGGAIIGTTYVGGITGYNAGINNNNARIFACYNTASVIGKADSKSSAVGGIVGVNYSKTQMIIACYNKGDIKDIGSPTTVSGTTSFNIGGIVGDNKGDPSLECYWLKGTSEKGIGSGTGSGTGTVSNFVIMFDLYFTPSNIPQWGTGNGETNGWWKAGTTNGNRLPQLWWE